MSSRVLFIGGLGRSGTTLLERSLGEFSEACAVGELVHLWHRGVENDERCGCGELFHECPFWRDCGEAAFGGWDNAPIARIEHLRHTIDRSRHIPGIALRGWRPALARDVEEYAGYYARLYAAVHTVSGADVIVDSSKHPSLAFCLAARSDIDLRVLHVVRDPRAVAHSWTKQVTRPEAHGDTEAQMINYSPARAATLWMSHNAALRALRRLGTPTLEVRSEDFASRPAEVLSDIARWAGLSTDRGLPVSADGVASLTAAHTVSGNPMRFETGEVRIKPPVETHGALPAGQRRVVTAITGPVLRSYGYPWSDEGGRS